ncbi:2TM domain-containing protein [Chryseobacterium soldanellicola]|uniref:2TM domain-containing protein n=1 Tax=Chryseobacterium soldanellicola TaxID=311333 RepID=A0A1H1AT45_9FLAO|nr:2TM domain-containing protein [Chryseobacterium soldanellicola]SDQ42928.1 2TM domain-containing protein [Chryseobacterium soldanellicola]
MDYNQAQERVNQLKKFYKSLTWFAIISIFLFFNDIFKNGKFELTFFNGSIILTIWGIILTVKAVKLFILNSDWEQKVLNEELKKTKQPIDFKS